MNYKEMLDKLEFMERKLAYLENENKHLKERVTKLEGNYWHHKTPGPGFTPGTIPSPLFGPNTIWGYSETTHYGAEGAH